ncbi:tyrosine-protein kinase family protein [Candidatus Poriferisodalis sp.]|uniref:tyrosine-protein kinase family protein n=1 Tax=Candidatus Poriferisodalis sp. TaxID=3101277 RepID=UPI003B027B75
MLTVYSTHGSPGASTLAVYLAAQWASSNREVVLIEADPTAGSLSQKLGIQFTPGTASFVAAGRPVTAANLIEHTQDVLFNNFHAMPTPSGPSGARTVAEKFSRMGEELRDISDREMAIIVDGGRLTADARASELTTSAAAVLVVSAGEAHLPSLEHASGALVDDPTQPGPLGLVATVGSSPLTDAEWSANHGLTLVGSVDLSPERGTDLTMFMPRSKRKSRKLRSSLEKLADTLYEYACPASAGAPRARLPANRPEVSEEDLDGADDTPTQAGPDELMIDAPPPVAPASPSPQPPAPAAMPPAPAQAYDQQAYPQQPYPQQPDPQQPYPQPGYEQPPPYPQPPYPHQPYPQQPDPQQPYPQPGYEQPPPYPQPPYPQPPYPQHDYPQQPYPQPGYEQPAHLHGGESAPPSYGQPASAQHQPEPPAAEPSPTPLADAPTAPSGSFRSWAAELFGESAGSDPDKHRSRPGEGVTA